MCDRNITQAKMVLNKLYGLIIFMERNTNPPSQLIILDTLLLGILAWYKKGFPGASIILYLAILHNFFHI